MASNGEIPDHPLSESEQALFDGIETEFVAPVDRAVARRLARVEKRNETAAARRDGRHSVQLKLGAAGVVAVAGMAVGVGISIAARNQETNSTSQVTPADIRAEALNNPVALAQTNTCAAELRVERDHIAANPRWGAAELEALYPPLYVYQRAITLAADVPCAGDSNANYTLTYNGKAYQVAGGVRDNAGPYGYSLLSQGSDVQDWCKDGIGMEPAGDVSRTYVEDIAALQKIAATACRPGSRQQAP